MSKKKEAAAPEVSYDERVQNAIRHWTVNGDPIKARDINRYLAKGEKVPPGLLNLSRVAPTVEVDLEGEGVEIPNRKGPGSGVNAWREFALATTDMDKEVVSTMTKEDLIAALESNGVIPAEEDEEA